ncbi:carboxymuconolactone decarboxylase family protein [Flavobacterium jejuense]|uniref:Carboxymuconolactone decarboxylase family protein n=2 Tax=Flavobacterium jejuense TaxID=1544455 RepID=A0ABX0IQT7_9FLAO|nr:carboxymuconolactone decarboxylase family protein [Flavobacterium jejuense]
MDTTKTERFNKGWEKLKEIDGQAGVNVIESLKDVSPDLAKYTIEYPFGDVYSRDILDNQTKEIAVVAALAAMGNATPQLKVHINAALNVGVTSEEISEVMIIMSVYAGFPSALNGTLALKDVLKERVSQE